MGKNKKDPMVLKSNLEASTQQGRCELEDDSCESVSGGEYDHKQTHCQWCNAEVPPNLYGPGCLCEKCHDDGYSRI